MFKTPMISSALCDYSDAYIVSKETISVTGTNNANRRNKKLIFKDNSDNYSERSRSLWNY